MPCKVLVVDDLEPCREITCELVSLLGYSSISALSGERAIELIKETSPSDHLVLLADFNLLDMTGAELCGIAKSIKLGCATVLTSGDPFAIGRSFSEKKDVDFFLAKPFSLQDLRDTLNRALMSVLNTGTGMTPSIFPSAAA